ncbi:MAG: putative lipid II flippase FtsW [Chthoniobacterales bacterium]|nr:putative lipid II flippase FtsW [Chthoniobacterales bacterium]
MQRHSIYLLLLSVVGLIALGIVMLFSTSAFAQDSHGDIYYFVKRQLFWLGIGLILCVGAAVVDYHWWRRTWPIWLGVSVILLMLCFVPHIGMRLNGSSRWLNLRVAAFQPSEIGKLASVFFLAWWFSREEVKGSGNFLQTMVIPLAVLALPLALIAAEVDLGTTALIGTMALALMFVGGARLLYLVPMLGAGFAGLIGLIYLIPERAARMMTFLHPESDKLGKGLQQWQALIAFGSGGIEGLGLGEGRQKMLYLPYAHTDFIFPMIGEELGLRATWAVIFCYVLILLSGGLIAANARDRFGKLLALGLVFLISLQAIVNIGMTISLLPNKGMPLPFISYGGTDLAVCLFMIGILVNIHRGGIPLVVPEERATILNSRALPRV